MTNKILIGITGGSGSGKTTFISRLRKAFTIDELCIVKQDDYYRPREEQELDQKGIKNFDKPTSIHRDEFYRDILQLVDDQKVTRTEYTFNNEKATPQSLSFYPAPVIVIEGLFVFHFEEVRNLLDLKIFLDAKENLKVIRRIKRDQVERNYPLEDVLYRYEHHVLPTFEKYIQPYRDSADIVINNNDHFNQAYAVVEGYLRHHLDHITS